MRIPMSVLALLAALSTATRAQQPIPIRQLAPVEARSVDRFMPGAVIRELTDGRVLFSNPMSPTLTMCDAKLALCRVVLDSNTLTPGIGGLRQMAIMPFTADSTLVVDAGAAAILVLDAAGKTARVMAMPKASDALNVGLLGSPAMDPQGRLAYRARFAPPRATPPAPGSTATRFVPPPQPDSFPIVRASFETRTVDTIAVISAPSGVRMVTELGANNQLTRRMIWQPLPLLDDWAMLSDGSIAIVRGHDYHIDWFYPDGSRASTPKMPFDWRRITDTAKRVIRDSMVMITDRMRRAQDSMAASRPATPGAPTFSMPVSEVVPVDQIPDYYPSIRVSSVKSDRDGNLWVLPSTSYSARGGLLYDVINRKGEIVERVQMPTNTSLAGFGPGGVVYYVSYEGNDGAHLVKSRVVRPK